MIDYDSFSRYHLMDIYFRFSRGSKRVKNCIHYILTYSDLNKLPPDEPFGKTAVVVLLFYLNM